MNKFNPIEFWKYSYSNFIDNRNRSALAEFIVAKALGVTNTPETGWESYDIETKDGLKIEVKSSGYIQSWHQKEPTIPTFEIKKKYGWNNKTNDWDYKRDRQADVYVFSVHNEKDPDKANPLNPDQWIFYVVPTSVINEKLKDQKTVRISTIETILDAVPIKYDALKSQILNCSNLKNR